MDDPFYGNCLQVMKTDDDIFVNVPLLHQALFKEYDNLNKIIGKSLFFLFVDGNTIVN